jgi:hypothetical protein
MSNPTPVLLLSSLLLSLAIPVQNSAAEFFPKTLSDNSPVGWLSAEGDYEEEGKKCTTMRGGGRRDECLTTLNNQGGNNEFQADFTI